jgi:hypothetical protein
MQETIARRSAVYPLIIGDKDHLYRPLPDDRYGVVVCVPVLKVRAARTARCFLLQMRAGKANVCASVCASTGGWSAVKRGCEHEGGNASPLRQHALGHGHHEQSLDSRAGRTRAVIDCVTGPARAVRAVRDGLLQDAERRVVGRRLGPGPGLPSSAHRGRQVRRTARRSALGAAGSLQDSRGL